MLTKINDIQDKIKALRDAYAEKLPEKIKEIETVYKSLIDGNEDYGSTTIVLHRLLHGLAGSGATFGFPVIGQRARHIEQILKLWIEKDVPADNEDQNHISILLKELFDSVLSEKSENLVFIGVPDNASRSSSNVSSLVYILDDDADIAEDLSVHIDHFGYEAKVFTRIDDLLLALEKKLPAVVISDVIFPEGEMAGITAMREYREAHAPDLPVIFISTSDFFNARLEAVRAGGEAYFSKPVNIDQLIDRMDVITRHDLHEPYRILIVDDDPVLADYYDIVLSQAGMKVLTTSQPEKIFELMAGFCPELILMDVYMPNCSGLDLAKLIRQQDAYISTPIVYLSTESDGLKQLAALNAGGDDFLTKPITDETLISSIAIRVKRARKLCDLMSQDSLTGLLKHTKIKAALSNDLSRAKRKKSKLTFVMIDIDNFKKVNDTYGHMSGDRVIKTLARLLQQRLRKSDSIGRYGGEEFAVVLHDASVDDALNIMNEIRESFSSILFLHEGCEFTVTFSAGISGYPQHDNDEVINQAADNALYRAKDKGRNCIVIDDQGKKSG